MSQSPLNLTRSQGSSKIVSSFLIIIIVTRKHYSWLIYCSLCSYYLGSSEEGGDKSDDEVEYGDDSKEKNGLGDIINEDENIANSYYLPTTENLFPWNISLDVNNKLKQHQDDKITTQPPQLLLTSGQLTTGCLQAAQLLIPTARGNKYQ